ncbi:MAG: NAD-dependent epimerase/dehydratase family protein [Bacteroidales bacterium]|nr:NAD-dependent epimerase/dehydratase family protein [Bacteroidales bacterium]
MMSNNDIDGRSAEAGKKRLVALTGATGTMGSATVKELLRFPDRYRLRLLVRDTPRNRKKTKGWFQQGDVEIVWGDLLDKSAVRNLVKGADVVLHIGGMVSPVADWQPEKTLKVNVGAARNIVDAILSCGQKDSTALVYIGSVAQYGPRAVPNHWAGPGDPMNPALHDMYAVSKIEAERIVAESGIRRWVSLRQSGILSPALLFNGNDPIAFHVPVNGVLEWATVEDSARLMEGICRENVDSRLWGGFYDIGSGKEYRLTNYQFECMLLKALSCPPPEKVFNADWFALRNFHGIWYWSADRLQQLVPFRANESAGSYFDKMSRSLPFYFGLAAIVPAPLIKFGMKWVASRPVLGTLWWRKTHDPKHDSYFGPLPLPRSWEEAVAPAPVPDKSASVMFDIGYDRSRDKESLSLDDMKSVARRRGGECLEREYTPGDLHRPLKWRCGEGHEFEATGAVVALGGHWCPECGHWPTPERLRTDPLLKEAFMSTHLSSELD